MSLSAKFKIIFCRRYFIKKIDSENVPTQFHDFELRICAQTQELYIVEMFLCLKCILKNLSTILHIRSSTTIHCRSLPLS